MNDERTHTNDPKHEHGHGAAHSGAAGGHGSKSGHEEGDINVGSVYKFMMWLAVLMVFSYCLVYGIMKMNDARVRKEDANVMHLSKSKSDALPPEPRLQLAPGHTEHPLDEGLEYRDSVIHDLESYGYLNKATGTVHIPIDRAKELLLQKGFAVRANADGMDDGRIMIPSFSSAGRVFERRDQRIPGGTFTVTGGNLNVHDTMEGHVAE